jgi:hypothetical protein
MDEKFVGTVVDILSDYITVRIYACGGSIHLTHHGRQIAVYDASMARDLASMLNAAADRCGDD